jgi:hypothetical protein
VPQNDATESMDARNQSAQGAVAAKILDLAENRCCNNPTTFCGGGEVHWESRLRRSTIPGPGDF